jgi:hypothetical protein
MIHFRIDRDLRLRTATFTGTIADGELLDSYRAHLGQPDYDPTLDDLVDLREVEHLDVSAGALKEMNRMFAGVDEYGIPTRLAIVAPGDLGYGLGRMYEMMRDGAPETIRVFRDAETAHAWLAEGRAWRASHRIDPADGGALAAS